MTRRVMLYHKTEGEPLSKSAARFKIFDADKLPPASSGWRDSPEKALKARKRADSNSTD